MVIFNNIVYFVGWRGFVNNILINFFIVGFKGINNVGGIVYKRVFFVVSNKVCNIFFVIRVFVYKFVGGY